MKNIAQMQSMFMLAFFLSLPFVLLTQEESKEKKVHIKTVKEVNGEKVVTDTTFYVSGDDDVKKVVKTMTVDSDGDSSVNVMVDVMVDGDQDTEWVTDSGKKVLIVKKGFDDGDHDVVVKKKVIVIDGDGEEKHVMVYPHGSTQKVIKFKSDDGEDFEFKFDMEMENLEEEMAALNEEMKELEIIIMDEEMNVQNELIEIHKLAAIRNLEELEHIKEMEVFMAPSEHHFAPSSHGDFTWYSHGSDEVTDEELRDAGVKNKPDRLELDEIDINNEDGVIDLSFTLGYEGTPKVDVYNVYGDKVFSGKPELMNNKYQIKMDLSKKQHGNYYLMIVLGSSSKTMRLKI